MTELARRQEAPPHPAIAASMPCVAIDKGIPLPPEIKTYNKYPLAQMAVGDSFLAPASEGSFAQQRDRAKNAARVYGQRHGKKFTCRTLQMDGRKVVRVWRVT